MCYLSIYLSILTSSGLYIKQQQAINIYFIHQSSLAQLLSAKHHSMGHLCGYCSLKDTVWHLHQFVERLLSQFPSFSLALLQSPFLLLLLSYHCCHSIPAFSNLFEAIHFAAMRETVFQYNIQHNNIETQRGAEYFQVLYQFRDAQPLYSKWQLQQLFKCAV